MTTDLLAIGAHPDDCELFAGGLLARLAEQGRRVAMCDLTRGEAASRGTPEERSVSARKAAEILSITERVGLDLGDGGLENTPQARQAIVAMLRHIRPRAVLTHNSDDRHPDHMRAHRLVRECCFYATVGRLDAPGERLESPPHLFYFFGNARIGSFQPDFIVPLHERHYQRRAQALAAYSSQFYNPGAETGDAPRTLIASREYARAMEARYRFFGGAVDAEYGEPYALEKPPAIADPLGAFFGPFGS